MTPRQRKFCDEYIASGNATDAAIKAGYSVRTARQIAAENLSKPDLCAYIEAELEKLHCVKIADATEVMEYLTSVMRGEQTEQILQMTGEGAQVITDIGVSARERLKAAELIGKRFGLFRENVDVTGSIPVVISGGDQLED